MMYNKQQFQKTNDKKVLHKVKKHWVVVSLAMLGALGIGSVSTTAVHASATPQKANDQTPQSANAKQPMTLSHAGDQQGKSVGSSSVGHILNQAHSMASHLMTNYLMNH